LVKKDSEPFVHIPGKRKAVDEDVSQPQPKKSKPAPILPPTHRRLLAGSRSKNDSASTTSTGNTPGSNKGDKNLASVRSHSKEKPMNSNRPSLDHSLGETGFGYQGTAQPGLARSRGGGLLGGASSRGGPSVGDHSGSAHKKNRKKKKKNKQEHNACEWVLRLYSDIFGGMGYSWWLFTLVGCFFWFLDILSAFFFLCHQSIAMARECYIPMHL